MSFHQEAQQVLHTVQELGKRRGRADPVRVRQLPAGTVTFVLTDIEGSTGLLNELASTAMPKHSPSIAYAFATRSPAMAASRWTRRAMRSSTRSRRHRVHCRARATRRQVLIAGRSAFASESTPGRHAAPRRDMWAAACIARAHRGVRARRADAPLGEHRGPRNGISPRTRNSKKPPIWGGYPVLVFKADLR
jgi:hypothetical protein